MLWHTHTRARTKVERESSRCRQSSWEHQQSSRTLSTLHVTDWSQRACVRVWEPMQGTLTAYSLAEHAGMSSSDATTVPDCLWCSPEVCSQHLHINKRFWTTQVGNVRRWNSGGFDSVTKFSTQEGRWSLNLCGFNQMCYHSGCYTVFLRKSTFLFYRIFMIFVIFLSCFNNITKCVSFIYL